MPTNLSKILYTCRLVNCQTNVNKKAVLSQRRPRNAPYTRVPWKFSGLPAPTATIPNIFHGILFGSTLWMFLQNLKSVALPFPGITGLHKKIGAVPGYAHASFSPKFLTGFHSVGPYPPNLKSVALPVPEITGVLKNLGSPCIRPRSIFF